MGPAGPLRKAHPASGAQWTVQVVRSRTEGCLWNACKALAVGLLLLTLGAAMAVIGYYAEELSENRQDSGSKAQDSATSTAPSSSSPAKQGNHRSFHLNNLSYVGPIIMGVGGFIVVAACVMTFEARDSAAKVMPARYKLGCVPSSRETSGQYDSRHVSLQSISTQPDVRRDSVMGTGKMGRCASLPQLAEKVLLAPQQLTGSCGLKPLPPTHLLLNPAWRRFARSMDEDTRVRRFSSESLAGSQCSMALDLHQENRVGSVTLQVKDFSRQRLHNRHRTEDPEHRMKRHSRHSSNREHRRSRRSSTASDSRCSRKPRPIKLRYQRSLETAIPPPKPKYYSPGSSFETST